MLNGVESCLDSKLLLEWILDPLEDLVGVLYINIYLK